MNATLPTQLIRLGLLLAVLTALPATAADIARDVRRGATAETRTTENYFELGVAFVMADGPAIRGEDEEIIRVTPTINGYAEWNGLFIEAFTESYNEVVFGYNAYQGSSWSFDLMMTPQVSEIDEDEYESLTGIEDRDPTLLAGFRANAYFGNTIFQTQVLSDIGNEHDGWSASLLIGRNWQHRNWNFHTIIGAQRQSDKMNNYYYGIRPNEVSERFPLYEAGAGTVYSVEVGVTYPINEKWILRSTLLFADIPDTLLGTPLLEPETERNIVGFILGTSRVF